MHRFIFVVVFIIGTLLALALRKANVFVLVKIDCANVVLIFFIVVKIYTALAKGHNRSSFLKFIIDQFIIS